MAAYCTQADLVERYGTPELAQLTDESAAATPVTAEITKVIDEATSLIDGYLSRRYATPLSPVPTIVRAWCCVISRKLLWKDRADNESPIIRAYNDAMRQIKDVANANADLPDATGAKQADTGGFARSTPTAVFDTSGLNP